MRKLFKHKWHGKYIQENSTRKQIPFGVRWCMNERRIRCAKRKKEPKNEKWRGKEGRRGEISARMSDRVSHYVQESWTPHTLNLSNSCTLSDWAASIVHHIQPLIPPIWGNPSKKATQFYPSVSGLSWIWILNPCKSWHSHALNVPVKITEQWSAFDHKSIN